MGKLMALRHCQQLRGSICTKERAPARQWEPFFLCAFHKHPPSEIRRKKRTDGRLSFSKITMTKEGPPESSSEGRNASRHQTLFGVFQRKVLRKILGNFGMKQISRMARAQFVWNESLSDERARQPFWGGIPVPCQLRSFIVKAARTTDPAGRSFG